mmetsp:Transcript_3044/g.4732  ORF Transcript_3044/g.4732 Transcript_3044/m.4732 type:complete len:86 (+) Transcript_3044:59-316(+)
MSHKLRPDRPCRIHVTYLWPCKQQRRLQSLPMMTARTSNRTWRDGAVGGPDSVFQPDVDTTVQSAMPEFAWIRAEVPDRRSPRVL